MEIVSGVFEERAAADRALEELMTVGVPRNRVVYLAPGTPDSQLERSIPVTDSEKPGMGAAMGATVGGALGAAGGATLGLAAAALAVPGVGPVIAIGALAASVLGIAGAATGAVAGESIEETLGGGLPHEDLYIYEEALRLGHRVVVALAETSSQADSAREIMTRNGALDFDDLRNSWWEKRRHEERTAYNRTGRDFERDEDSYRRGFEAALHPARRGKSYAEAEGDLRQCYSDDDLDTAFRHGFEGGKRYHVTTLEQRKG
jgi:hypothetical protein